MRSRGNAEGAGKLERVGDRHQPGAAGRRIGDAAAAGQRFGGSSRGLRYRLRGRGHDRSGLDLRFGEKTKDGLRRLDVQARGMPVHLFGTRRDHHSFSLERTIPKKYHLSSAR